MKEISDRSGCKLKVLDLDGRLFPAFSLDELKAYPSIRVRDDDVILCAYPKSGTHWLWEVSMMLLRNKAETIQFKKSLQMMEFNSTKLDDFPSPRVLNTHVPYDALPEDVITRRTRLVLVLRNPKDTAVSFYNHHVNLSHYYGYTGSFGDWLDLFLSGRVDYGSWFEYVKSWETVLERNVDHPIHVVMYEDVKEDPARETKRLAEFLGVTADPELIRQVADKCDFDRMAEDKKAHQDSAEIMFRKGIVGDWKNTFTVAQNEVFDTVFKEQMKSSKLSFRYSLQG